MLNWPTTHLKKNVVFEAVGAAEGGSDYILAMNLNYDPSVDVDAVNKDAKACGDLALPHSYRKYARLWLSADFDDPLRTRRRLRKHQKTMRGGRMRATTSEIEEAYSEALLRRDIEESSAPDPDLEQAPRRGMQVHSEYTLYGSLYALEAMTRGAERVTLYMDQESGIRAAALLAFRERILRREADAFYVRSNYELTVPERETSMEEKASAIMAARARWPELDDYDLRLAMIAEARGSMTEIGRWGDRWMTHPLPTKGEPEKSVSWLTELDGYTDRQINQLYHDASLSSVDRSSCCCGASCPCLKGRSAPNRTRTSRGGVDMRLTTPRCARKFLRSSGPTSTTPSSRKRARPLRNGLDSQTEPIRSQTCSAWTAS